MSQEISKFGVYTTGQVEVIRRTIAKETTDAELGLFLNIAAEAGLSPFRKEIWCYKDHKGNLITFAGRDGFLTAAQRSPVYAGIRSCEVREGDDIKIDIPNGKVHHNKKVPNKGNIIGAYAIVFRKDGEPTIEWADFDVYYRGKKANGQLIYSSPWNTHQAAMIKKVAETNALKKAFGISGIQSEYEFSVNDGVATPIETEVAESIEEELFNEIADKIGAQKTKEDLLGYYEILDPIIRSHSDISQLFTERKKEILNERTKEENSGEGATTPEAELSESDQ
jgi:recombinational DNA repair protein RecT